MASHNYKKLAEFLQKAKSGDQEALQNLCKMLEGFIRAYFRSRFREKALIDDLCQETYLRLLKNFSKIREEMKLTAFVAKVAFHVTQDHFRRKYRSREEALETDYQTEEGPQSRLKTEPVGNPVDLQVLDRIDLETALKQLPEKSRLILQLKTQGYKYEEIAEKTGLSVSGVKMQVKRSMEQLRKLLFLFFWLLTKIIICFL